MSGGVVGTLPPRIRVFRPTIEEFADFPGYINYMESQGAHKAGLAKVIPPKEWIPRKRGYDDIGHVVIPSPISQLVNGRQGLYQQYNIQKRSMTVAEFEKLASSEKYRTPDHFDYEDLERKYWKNLTYNTPIYGADVSGSLYDPGVKEWNINHLNTILDCVSGDYGVKIDGVNTAYLYFGMWKTSFAWHTEDMDLYSINYLHFGAPKSWYVIPPEHGKRLERLAFGFFPSSYKLCPAFLRHKMTIISPQILKSYSIPIDKITQEPGEFMVTFPYGYHAGYNHGFNCAESTNFATERWVEYGKRASQCICRNDSVKISMDTFVKRFQPDRYELWRIGKDIGPHPEDLSKCTAAPPPSNYELVLNDRPKATEKRRRMMNCVSKRHPITEFGAVPSAKRSSKRTQEEETNSDTVETVFTMPVKDEDREEHVRGLKCHIVISKANDFPNEYTSCLGGLVKLEPDSNKSPLDGATTVITSNKSLLSSLPETVLKLHKHVVDPSVPFIVQSSTTPQSPVRRYKSILLPRKDANPAVKTEPISPISILPNDTYAAADYSSSMQSNLSPMTCSFEPPQMNGVNLLEIERSPSTNNPLHLTKGAPCLQGRSNGSESMDAASLYDSFQSATLAETSIKLEGDAGVFRNVNANVASNEEMHATKGSMHCRLEMKTCISSKPASKSVGKRLADVDTLKSSVTALGKQQDSSSNVLSREPSPPLLLPACPNQSRGNTPRSNNELDILMPILPQEPRCVTPVTSKHVDTDVKDDADRTRACPKDTKPSTFHSKSGDWARPLTKLWQHTRTNFDAEMAFNEFCAETEPHCSICSLFAPQQFKGLELDIERRSLKPVSIPSHSRVLMPEAVFLSASQNYSSTLPLGSSDDEDGVGSMMTMTATEIGSLSPISRAMSNLDDSGCSRLLVCEDCKVCVHASCYGVLNFDSSLGSRWRCSRCIRQNVNAECCLCVLRGGALKPTTDGRWAHVVCTLVVHDVFFETVPSREPVNISSITLARLKLNCYFCRQLVRRCGRFSGACIQCTASSDGKCSTAFHVTCGIAAGVKFEACDWPELIQVTCPAHNAEKRREELVLPELLTGQVVIARYRLNLYDYGMIVDKNTKVFYKVSFDATTICDNLYPVDVKSHDCLRNGPPAVDEPITLLWTDKKVYEAVFRGTNTVIKYVIEFEDGTRRRLERENIFTLDEELPMRVKSKLATSSSAGRRRPNETSDLEDEPAVVIRERAAKKQKKSYV